MPCETVTVPGPQVTGDVSVGSCTIDPADVMKGDSMSISASAVNNTNVNKTITFVISIGGQDFDLGQTTLGPNSGPKGISTSINVNDQFISSVGFGSNTATLKLIDSDGSQVASKRCGQISVGRDSNNGGDGGLSKSSIPLLGAAAIGAYFLSRRN